MICCTEIFSKPEEYDTVTGTVKGSYGIREIFINSKFVVSMKENNVLKQTAQKKDLIEGLNKDLSFTQIVLDAPQPRGVTLDIIGSPQEIIEKITMST